MNWGNYFSQKGDVKMDRWHESGALLIALTEGRGQRRKVPEDRSYLYEVFGEATECLAFFGERIFTPPEVGPVAFRFPSDWEVESEMYVVARAVLKNVVGSNEILFEKTINQITPMAKCSWHLHLAVHAKKHGFKGKKTQAFIDRLREIEPIHSPLERVCAPPNSIINMIDRDLKWTEKVTKPIED